jgi:hypothetical protein
VADHIFYTFLIDPDIMPATEGAAVPPLGAGATSVSLEQNFLRVLVEPGPKDTEVE